MTPVNGVLPGFGETLRAAPRSVEGSILALDFNKT